MTLYAVNPLDLKVSVEAALGDLVVSSVVRLGENRRLLFGEYMNQPPSSQRLRKLSRLSISAAVNFDIREMMSGKLNAPNIEPESSSRLKIWGCSVPKSDLGALPIRAPDRTPPKTPLNLAKNRR